MIRPLNVAVGIVLGAGLMLICLGLHAEVWL